eukprot:gene5804-biopygen4274
MTGTRFHAAHANHGDHPIWEEGNAKYRYVGGWGGRQDWGNGRHNNGTCPSRGVEGWTFVLFPPPSPCVAVWHRISKKSWVQHLGTTTLAVTLLRAKRRARASHTLRTAEGGKHMFELHNTLIRFNRSVRNVTFPVFARHTVCAPRPRTHPRRCLCAHLCLGAMQQSFHDAVRLVQERLQGRRATEGHPDTSCCISAPVHSRGAANGRNISGHLRGGDACILYATVHWTGVRHAVSSPTGRLAVLFNIILVYQVPHLWCTGGTQWRGDTFPGGHKWVVPMRTRGPLFYISPKMHMQKHSSANTDSGFPRACKKITVSVDVRWARRNSQGASNTKRLVKNIASGSRNRKLETWAVNRRTPGATRCIKSWMALPALSSKSVKKPVQRVCGGPTP